MSDPNEPDIVEEKRQLRKRMRAIRLALPDRPERSRLIVEHLVGIDRVRAARRLLAYTSIPGEVETSELVDWCRSGGVEVAMPEDTALDPAWADVIVVPGTAFTVRGDRIGQGGGWYDRFLPGRRSEAFTVGIGFWAQMVEALPVEDHDIRLDCIVTENGVLRPEAGSNG